MIPLGTSNATWTLPPATEEDQSESNALTEHLNLLLRHKLLCVGLALTGLLGSLIYSVTKPDLYRSSVTVEIRGLNEGFMNLQEVDPRAASENFSATASNIQTYLLLLASNSFRGRVAQRVKQSWTLESQPRVGLLGKLRYRLGWEEANPVTFTEAALAHASATLGATRVGGSRLLELHCDSPSPTVAAAFLNAAVEQYAVENTSDRGDGAKQVSHWIQDQAGDAKRTLEESEHKLQDYAQRTGLLFLGEQDSVAQSKLRQLQTELTQAQSDRILKQTRYDLAVSQPTDSLPEVQKNAALQAYQSSLHELQSQLASLSSVYTQSSLKVIAVQAQIRELQNAVETERTHILDGLKNDYEAAKSREDLLQKQYSKQIGAVTGEGSRSIQYNMLRREVDSNRQLYNALLQQGSQAGIASAVPGSGLRVVDPAEPPPLPISPKLRSGVVSGVGLGFALANGIVFLLGRKNRRNVTLPGHAELLLNVQELGVIPRAPKRVSLPTSPRQKMLREVESMAQTEAFRLTVASILRKVGRNKGSRVYIVSSPQPGDGKTTITAQLGCTMAQMRIPTLLIDADPHAPKLHEYFRLKNETGFTDVLSGSVPMTERAAAALIRPTEIPNLDILTVGSERRSAMDVAQFAQFLELLRPRYATILVDTPPLLQFSDARLLACEGDGVILVLRSGVTDRESARAACQQLMFDGIPLIGTILNEFTPTGPWGRQYREYYGQRNGLSR